MHNKPLRYKFLNLHSLIVLLGLLVAFITAINGFYATHKVQRERLIVETLNSNQAYAKKLASSTEGFIRFAYQQLEFTAHLTEKRINDQEYLQHEIDHLHQQTDSFNSVAIINRDAVVLAASESVKNIIGKKIATAGVLESIKVKAPMVSLPYMSSVGNLIAIITYPMFNEDGDYLGYVGGTMYLKEHSVLNDLLGENFFQDGSYVYVIDQNKQIIYHPDVNLVGTYSADNSFTRSALSGHSGAFQVTNPSDIEMLAGFATIKSARWSVVVQKPLKDTLAPLEDILLQVFLQMMPVGILTTFLIVLLAIFLSRPLRKLAINVGRMDNPAAYDGIAKISSWYAESFVLKQAVLNGLTLLNVHINQLRHDADTDPLTGVYNCRGLQFLLDKLVQNKIPFSVLAVDIDHFKNINDTYGHGVGDKILVMLANTMRDISRGSDVVARTGGEEFLLILPNSSEEIALNFAERLRICVSEIVTEPAGSITISIGITICLKHKRTIEETIKNADQALYRAKELGRNRCEVF